MNYLSNKQLHSNDQLFCKLLYDFEYEADNQLTHVNCEIQKARELQPYNF